MNNDKVIITQVFSENDPKYQQVKKTIDVISDKLDGSNQNTNNTEVSNDYDVLFLSFDIVNSTQFKVNNRNEWLVILNDVLNELVANVYRNIKNAELWRIIGDEIIFVVKVHDEDTLRQYVRKTFDIIQMMNQKIDLNQLDNEIETSECNIGIQGAAWLAKVTDERRKEFRKDCKYGNVFFTYEKEDANHFTKVYEFEGNDIDTGFRIKKYTRKGRLVLGFELAYIVSESTEYNSKLHIITYKRLKGVWNEKLYPIVWYHHETQKCSFKDSFLYDAVTDDELAKEYFANRKGDKTGLKKSMYGNAHKALKRVMQDRKLEAKIEDIRKTMTSPKTLTYFTMPEEIKLQLSAVCYDKEKKKILLWKRKGNVNNENKYECGHVLVGRNKENIKWLEEGYKNKYKIDIEVCKDEKEKDNQPIPLYLYQYSSLSGCLYEGVTCLATIKGNTENIEIDPSNNEYDEIRWIAEDEVDALSDEMCVDDLKVSLKKAFIWYKENI